MQLTKFILISIFTCAVAAECLPQNGYARKQHAIETRWAKDINPSAPHNEYPRPQMTRSKWINLNGLWNYSITDTFTSRPEIQGQILVPYPLESALSGVQKPLYPNQFLWYQRNILKPAIREGERALLHFGAVDYKTTVYINSHEVGSHDGGYQNFSFDITDFLDDSSNEITVKVQDPTDNDPAGLSDQSDAYNAFGKQSLKPVGIFYTASSGIWQTVWLEIVPATYIGSLHITPDVDHANVSIEIDVAGEGKHEGECTIEAIAYAGKTRVAATSLPSGKKIVLTVPGMHLWFPDDPFLYDLHVRLLINGKSVDEVKSYFGMRKVEKKKTDDGHMRLLVNNKFIFNQGVLDQGFWPDGLYTAATDEALAFDIQAVKAMGFNTIRKHIKIEPARWYYHCDRLGVLVWQDMPSKMSANPVSNQLFEQQLKESLHQLHHFPSIIAWNIFNESWGEYDQQRLFSQTKNTDPSRIVNGHSGINFSWGRDKTNTEVIDFHGGFEEFNKEYHEKGEKVKVIGEYYGPVIQVQDHMWHDIHNAAMYAELFSTHYTSIPSADSFKEAMHNGLSGAMFVQLTDVEDEMNGLLTYDRKVIKVPIESVRRINEKLVGRAANAKKTISGFSIGLMDTSDANTRYKRLSVEYKRNRRDSALLRKLSLVALQAEDHPNAEYYSNEYLRLVTNRLHPDNLRFASRFLFSTESSAFSIFMQHIDTIEKILPTFYFKIPFAENELVRSVTENHINHLRKENRSLQELQNLGKPIVEKFARIGEIALLTELLVQSQQKQDWTFFTTAISRYLTLRPCFTYQNEGEYINWFRTILAHVDDLSAVRSAATCLRDNLLASVYWTRILSPENLKLLAGLMYKYGDTRGARGIMENALKLSRDDKEKEEIKNTIQKMADGQRIW